MYLVWDLGFGIFFRSNGLFKLITLRAIRRTKHQETESDERISKCLFNAPLKKVIQHLNITQTCFNHFMTKFPFVEIQSVLHLHFSFLSETVVIERLFSYSRMTMEIVFYPFSTIPGADTKSSRSSCVVDSIKRPLSIYE